MALVAEAVNQGPHPLEIARQRLFSARLAAKNDHLLDLALRKAREIVLYRPKDSVAGRALLGCFKVANISLSTVTSGKSKGVSSAMTKPRGS